MPWIYFLYILGEFGNKIPRMGKYLTGFGRAWIDQTHSLRKNMKSTWVMNKSLCEVFIEKIRHRIHIRVINNLPLKFGLKQSTLKIWVFQARRLGFRLSPLDQEFVLEKNSHGFLRKIHKSFRKHRSLIFHQICLETKIFKNQGNFELKLSYWATINSIRGIKFWNFVLKI